MKDEVNFPGLDVEWVDLSEKEIDSPTEIIEYAEKEVGKCFSEVRLFDWREQKAAEEWIREQRRVGKNVVHIATGQDTYVLGLL